MMMMAMAPLSTVLAVLCLVAGFGFMGVGAQTPTPTPTSTVPDTFESATTPSGTLTVTITSLPGEVIVPTYPATQTTCFIPPTGTVSTTQVFDPAGPLPPAVECWFIIQSAGVIIETEIFSLPGASPSILPEPVGGSSALGGSSSKLGGGALAGIIVGSIVGFLLIAVSLCVITVYVRRTRQLSRTMLESTRAGKWIKSGAWVPEEKRQDNQFELANRRPGA